MASFETFRDKLWAHFEEMIKDGAPLFRTGIPYEDMWDVCLNSFTEEENPIFRVRRTYDCSCCRHFIRDFGDVVTVKDGILTSIWDVTVEAPFDKVCKNLSALAKSDHIEEPFWSRGKRIGTEHSTEYLDIPVDLKGYGRVQTVTYKHFYVDIPDSYYKKWSDRSRGDYVNEVESSAIVLKRAAEDISLEAIDTVLELIANGNLYKGDEWQTPLKLYRKTLEQCKTYNQNDYARFVNYCWEASVNLGPAVSRIRNHSIGVLITDISEGVDLETAVRKYEKIVAPTNYKRPKAIYTKAMLQKAKEEIEELGFRDSLKRRFATKEDIPLKEVIFYDSSKKQGSSNDIFEEMEKECAVNPRKFENAETIYAEDFYKKIANGEIQSLDILLENRLTKNFCSLTAPEVADSKSMFKWASPIGWAYTGNITDSMIKENVKVAGGNVECDLRFSIQWNDGEMHDANDLDAHCTERYDLNYNPAFSDTTAFEIYYGVKRKLSPSKGMLDIDIIRPAHGEPAVENIFYQNLKDMKDGTYTFSVHTYTCRRVDAKTEFKAQLDILGDVREFEYSGKSQRWTGNHDYKNAMTPVAVVTIKNGKVIEVRDLLESSSTPKEKWGIMTNQFHPVTMIIDSPNCWDSPERVVGNRHKFFIVKDMKNDENPNAFFNEFLTEDLGAHKRFMEALGGKLQIADAERQLSGVGFSSTIRNYAFFRINGKKVIKVAF